MNQHFIRKCKLFAPLLFVTLSLSACSAAQKNESASTMVASEGSEIMEYSSAELEVDSAEFNTEEYSAITDNSFKSVKDSPLSTFSADVDTASYSNVRRMINDNIPVPPDAVRIEEMINYFKYDYPQPNSNVPFSGTYEISNCPWNEKANLLRIGLQGYDIDYTELPSSNLVFLLDISGSMNSYDKLPLVQKSFQMLTENLKESDRISIVTYAGSDSVILQGVSGANKQKINLALENLFAGGSTAGSKGIETAYDIAQKNFIKDGNNRIILATDGDLNVGITSEGDLKRLVESYRDNGIFLSVLGFGTENIKDNKMETLADNGNGNYSYIDSVQEAKKVLVEEMGGTLLTIAKDVKFQVEFNPAVIQSYRLIGYENRLLNTEDFNDDKKDAGEIGAGHRVTALYELIMNDSGNGTTGTELKYQQSEIIESDDWLTVSIRYKKPDSNESLLISNVVDSNHFTKSPSDDFKFVAAVAEFGMLLRNSEHKGNASYQRVNEILQSIDGVKDDPYKDEFAYLVRKVMNQN